MQDLIEQEKNCTGHIDSKSPWKYSATNNTPERGEETIWFSEELLLASHHRGYPVPSWQAGRCWRIACLPTKGESQVAASTVLCVYNQGEENWRTVSQECHPQQGWASHLCGNFLLLPQIQSSRPGGEVGEGSGEGDLWRVRSFVCDSSDGEGKREEGHLGNFRQLNRDGGSMGPKARGEAGGIIRSQSMQGLTSTIEFEPCFVSNGTFWTPLERPCIIVLIQLLSIFYIPRAALTTCSLFPTTANSTGSIIYPILQMRKLRSSEIKKLAQGYSSIKWGSWVWNSNSSLNVYPVCHVPEWTGWSDPGCWQLKPPSWVDFCTFAQVSLTFVLNQLRSWKFHSLQFGFRARLTETRWIWV